MPLLGPYTFKDYYQLYRRRKDVDYLSSWQHVNSMVMGQVKMLSFLVVFSVGAAIFVNIYTEKTASLIDRIQKKMADPAAFAQEVRSRLTPEEKADLLNSLREGR